LGRFLVPPRYGEEGERAEAVNSLALHHPDPDREPQILVHHMNEEQVRVYSTTVEVQQRCEGQTSS
jgi:hypothetical protein